MNAEDLVRSIFQRQSLDDCSVEELQTIARQYPYFSPVQLLLAEKLKPAGGPAYDDQLQKLSLYFNNPLWLDYLLNGYDSPDVTEKKAEDREAASDEPEPAREIETSPVSAEQSPAVETNSSESPANDGVESPEPVNETEVVPLVAETANENQASSSEEPQESLHESEFSVSENSATNSGDRETESQIPISLPALNEEITESEIKIEPYHLVDYFASQGIRFIPDDKPADRFGKQLKSFTEWLKAMKKLPQAEVVATTPSDGKIEQLAEHSIDKGDVLTETMAEVWAKQGNKEKAIEIYNKLGLLNPSKSAYFASLAEQVKNS